MNKGPAHTSAGAANVQDDGGLRSGPTPLQVRSTACCAGSKPCSDTLTLRRMLDEVSPRVRVLRLAARRLRASPARRGAAGGRLEGLERAVVPARRRRAGEARNRRA